MATRPKHIVEYVLMRTILALINLLPLKLSLVLIWPVARLSYCFMGKRSREARRRIRLVLGDAITEEKANEAAWISWRNIFFNVVEIAHVQRMSEDRLQGLFEGLELPICRKLNREHSGFTLAVCHMGNWELAGFATRTSGLPLFVMMRGQSNPLVTDYLNRVREKFKVGAIERHSRVLGSIIKRIKAGEIFTILPDIRNKTKESSVVVPYLGGNAYLTAGMAMFARHTNTPIVPVVVRRSGWFKHILAEQPAIYPDQTADKNEDSIRMTAEVMAIFDRAVRETPEQYFWYNKRWVLDDRF